MPQSHITCRSRNRKIQYKSYSKKTDLRFGFSTFDYLRWNFVVKKIKYILSSYHHVICHVICDERTYKLTATSSAYDPSFSRGNRIDYKFNLWTCHIQTRIQTFFHMILPTVEGIMFFNFWIQKKSMFFRPLNASQTRDWT